MFVSSPRGVPYCFLRREIDAVREPRGRNLSEYVSQYGIDSSEFANSIAVAIDSVQYLNYPQVGNWIDKYRLYIALDNDSLLLNSSPELTSFYDSTQGTLMGSIYEAERFLIELYDSTTNAENYADRYQAAFDANENIVNGEDWEMNEKGVNDVWLLLSHMPIDSVDSNLIFFVQELASSCPFVAGTAVYRARALWSIWEPNAVFDDRLICSQGQAKNLDYSNLNIDSLIESQVKTRMENPGNLLYSHSEYVTKRISENNSDIALYPNPASTQITVSYSCKTFGEFILYNSLGQIILKSSLQSGNVKTTLQLPAMANGVYTYKCRFEGCSTKYGKLNIEQ